MKVKTFERKLKLPKGLVSTNVRSSATKSECPYTQIQIRIHTNTNPNTHKYKSEYIQIQIRIHRGENIGKVKGSQLENIQLLNCDL